MQLSPFIRFNASLKLLISISAFLLFQPICKAQELVTNGGSEQLYYFGWQVATPGDFWVQGTQVTPHSGMYHFYPNTTVNASSEMFQDVGVSANAVSIDAGTAFYMFSGWRRGYGGTDKDRTQIIVEYRDASNNVLGSFDSGSAIFTSWHNDINNQYAPIGTRTIRIRLISVRVTGSDNDGYYDDISLTTCTAPSSIFIFPSIPTHVCLGSNLVVSGIALPSNSHYYYTWIKDGSPITIISNTFTAYSKPVTTASDAGIYALKVQDGTSNNAACSNIAITTFFIDPLPVAGTISTNQEICMNGTPNALTGTASTGGVALKYYKWQQSTLPTGPWSTSQNYNTTATGFAPGILSNTTYYRRIDSSGSCFGVPTNTIKIQVNNNASINSVTSLIRDTLCIGEKFQLIGNVNTASQPSLNGGYYFYWRKVQNGIVNTATTPSATLAAYPSIPKNATVVDSGTYYLVVQDGPNATRCKDSLKIVIRVNQGPTSKALIQSHQELCLTEPATVLTELKPGAGIIIGTLSHQWFTTQDTTGIPTLSKIPIASTGVTYNSGSPTTTNYYVRKDSVKYCKAIQTNFIKIRVNNKAVINSITTLVRDTLCIGENFQLTGNVNTASQPSLNGGYYFYWRKVQHGIVNTATTASATLATYPSIPKIATVLDSGTYYLVVQDGPNATRCKDSLKIVIRVNQGPTSKALIQSHQELCLNDPAALLTELSPSVGVVGGINSYQWYSSQDTTGTPTLSQLPIASSGITYNPGTPINTKYYVRKDSVKYCKAIQTNFIKIRVNNRTKLDSIRATVNDTLCVANLDQFQLKGYIDSLTAGKQSINGGFYFTWKLLQEPATIPIVVSATAPYTDYPFLSRPVVELDSGTYYLIVQDGINATKCLDSMFVKITVKLTCTVFTCTAPDFVSIKVSPTSSTTLCEGNTLSLEKDVITFPLTPPSFGYQYSWIRTNTMGSVVVKGPTSTYEDLVINSVTELDSGRYQLLVIDGALSPSYCSKLSLPISIHINPSVTRASIGNDTIICKSSVILPFKEKTSNTGGTGSYTYQWQSSSDNNIFSDISGATLMDYQSPTLLNTRYFRRVDKSGSCTLAITDTITVTTTTGVLAGTIQSSNQTLCFNTKPTQTIIGTSDASGGTGGTSSIHYQWQISSDKTNWLDIIGATSKDYLETNMLMDTTYYRRKVDMGPGNCDTTYTTPIQINVFGKNNPGVISKDSSICAGATIQIKELTKASGTINSYQWIMSTSKGYLWIDAPGNSTSKEYTTPGLSDTTWYKRIIKTPCKNDTSNLVIVSVITRPIVSAGNDTLVLKNSIIHLNGSVVGSTNYAWSPYTGLNNPTVLNPEAKITSSILYKLKAFDPSGQCSNERIMRISVKPPLIIPNVITPNGDGVNDIWTIADIQEYPNATFVIYNRWGNIVWKASNNSNEWNGTNYRNGEVLPDGTYFYIIDLNSISYDEALTGYVQLIH